MQAPTLGASAAAQQEQLRRQRTAAGFSMPPPELPPGLAPALVRVLAFRTLSSTCCVTWVIVCQASTAKGQATLLSMHCTCRRAPLLRQTVPQQSRQASSGIQPRLSSLEGSTVLLTGGSRTSPTRAPTLGLCLGKPEGAAAMAMQTLAVESFGAAA